jgi:hypothetical protein
VPGRVLQIWLATLNDEARSRKKERDQKKKCWERDSGTTLHRAAAPVDRVAIVRAKGYRDRVHFPAIHSWTVFLVAVEYFQEESSCKLRLRVRVGLKEHDRIGRQECLDQQGSTFCECFFMAQGRQTMVSRRSLSTVPPSHFVRYRP